MEKEYLTFKLCDGQYAVETGLVGGIRIYGHLVFGDGANVTQPHQIGFAKVPGLDSHIPIIDLRKIISDEVMVYQSDTPVIVLRLIDEAGMHFVCLVADLLQSTLLTIPDDQIETVPGKFATGKYTEREAVTKLINIHCVLRLAMP